MKWGKERGRGDRWRHEVWGQGPREGGGEAGGGEQGTGEQAGRQSCPRGEGGGGAEWRPSRERDRERKRVRELRKAMGGRRRGTGRGSYLLCHLSHGLDAGSIQVAVVLAGLDKLVGLNVLLHFLPGRHKVVIPAIYLVLPLGPRRICQEVTPSPKDLTTIPPASTLPTATPHRAQLVLRGRGLLGRPRPGEMGGAASPSISGSSKSLAWDGPGGHEGG